MKEQLGKVKSLSFKSGIPLLPSLIILSIFGVFLFFCWIVSDPLKASKIGGLFFYTTDEIFRYYLIKISLLDWHVFINTYIRPLYAVIATVFLHTVPVGMLSLRLMNAVFSCGSLCILYKIAKKLGFEDFFAILVIIITVFSPAYFLISISLHPEIIFCFFLLLAIYLFISKKYLFSTILVSLLPLIRIEGYFILFVWFFLCLEKESRRFKYIPLLFAPTILLALLNYLFLGSSDFLGRFFYQIGLRSAGMYGQVFYDFSRLGRFSELAPVAYLLSLGYPLLALFIIGVIIKFSDKRYRLFLRCFLVVFTFLGIANLMAPISLNPPINTYGFMERSMSAFSPIIAIFAMIAIRAVNKRIKIRFFILPILVTAIVCFFHILKMAEIQNKIQWDYLHPSETKISTLEDAATWFKVFAKERKINQVYISREESTASFPNKFIMYLPSNMKFYIVFHKANNTLALDIVTFKFNPISDQDAVYVTADGGKINIGGKVKFRLIRGFPEIPLYFYLLNGKDEGLEA